MNNYGKVITLETAMKTFTLYRRSKSDDGNAYVAPGEPTLEGVVFSDGRTVICWRTQHPSINVWNCFEDFWAIHGHEGDGYGTEVIWNL